MKLKFSIAFNFFVFVKKSFQFQFSLLKSRFCLEMLCFYFNALWKYSNSMFAGEGCSWAVLVCSRITKK